MSLRSVINKYESATNETKFSKADMDEVFSRIEELENDVDYWKKEYDDLSEIKDDLENKLEEKENYEGIRSLENFIWRAKLDNVYNEQLEKFIENYMRYYNA